MRSGVRVQLAVALPPVTVQCSVTLTAALAAAAAWYCSCCSSRWCQYLSVGRWQRRRLRHAAVLRRFVFRVVSQRPWFRRHREWRKAEFSVAVFSFQWLRRGVEWRWVTRSSRRVLKASMIAWTTVSESPAPRLPPAVTHWSSGRLTRRPGERAWHGERSYRLTTIVS